MGKLVLVKHSLPRLDPNVPSRGWHLSDGGRRRCDELAERLADYGLQAIATSPETKAVETAEILGEALSISPQVVNGLEEHHRDAVGLLPQEEFEALIEDLFTRPQSLVMGNETADQSHDRFSTALHLVIDADPEWNLAVVSHGTVMSLFVAGSAGIEPFRLWKSLGLPSFVVMSLPDLRLLEVVESVPGEGVPLKE